MTIALRPYDDLSAMVIFQALDPCDQYEVDLVRGAVTTPLALFAEWRAMQPGFVVSYIAQTGRGTPFAVFGLAHAGQAGVVTAGLLARDHRHFRRQLAQLGVLIRRHLPDLCRDNGIRRVEVRTWSDHPTAKGLLHQIGFCEECRLTGFGPAGADLFHQFSRVFTPSLHPDAGSEE